MIGQKTNYNFHCGSKLGMNFWSIVHFDFSIGLTLLGSGDSMSKKRHPSKS
jgi:hypothetical protein